MRLMNKDDVRGIIVPVVSPLDAFGALDIERFREEITYMHRSGVKHVIVGGSTGEGASLTGDEIASLVKIVTDGGLVTPIAGVLPTSTRDATDRARLARDAGAAALLLSPPIYVVPDDAALLRFVTDVHEASGLPIIFYNHFDASAATLRKVARLEGVISVKDASVIKIDELVQLAGDDVAVAVAIDPVPLAGFAIGATASITGVNAVLPAECVAVYEAFERGDLIEARRIAATIAPLARLLIEPLNFPAPVKYALEVLGRHAGAPRAPFQTLSAEQETAIRRALEFAGAL